MKIKYSVWVSDECQHHVERELAGGDYAAILRGLDDACDLVDLRYQKAVRERSVREAERRLEILASAHAHGPTPPPVRLGTGAHKENRVFEYDGAFHCLDCGSYWGALPGHPAMPAACSATTGQKTP